MSILDDIVENKKRELPTLEDVSAPEKCMRDFEEFFSPKPGLIAEVKAKSPSEGVIADNFQPVDQARAYIEGGATAISILTDEKFFGGSFDVLRQIRMVTDLPLLCKEFIIDPKQIRMARDCGADMVLLIVKILDVETLKSLKGEIEQWGMAAIIEVQSEEELDIALQVDPYVLLINNRNLSSFEVDMDTTANLLGRIPDHVKVIAASGIQDSEEIKSFPDRVDGFLIGTSLMKSDDPAAFLRRCR